MVAGGFVNGAVIAIAFEKLEEALDELFRIKFLFYIYGLLSFNGVRKINKYYNNARGKNLCRIFVFHNGFG